MECLVEMHRLMDSAVIAPANGSEWMSGAPVKGRVKKGKRDFRVENRSKSNQRRRAEKHFCATTTFKNFSSLLRLSPSTFATLPTFFFVRV